VEKLRYLQGREGRLLQPEFAFHRCQ